MSTTLSARQILDKLVSFPTVSRDSNLALVDWVQDYLDGFGVTSHRVLNDDATKASLFAHIGPEIDGGVVLSGHTDVVPVDGQDWHTDPWQVVEKDGRLFGRGTCDMKGFDALALAAVPGAQARGLKRPLQIALSHDEEVGCIGVRRLIDKLSQQRRKEIILEVRETNLAAQLFFRNQQFRAVKVLRNHYDDTTEDAYYMRYLLSEADHGHLPFSPKNHISEFDAA